MLKPIIINMAQRPVIPPEDILKSPFLSLMYKGSDKPTIFMPNYGEFGQIIDKVIKVVHFFEAPTKIICCKPGEEAYYPSANDFYYDWTYDLVDDIHKWGSFTKAKYWKEYRLRARNEKYTYYKQTADKEVQRIREHFGDKYNFVDLRIFNQKDMTWTIDYSHLFRFELKPLEEIKGLYADIIISPRNKKCRADNNFDWTEFCNVLVSSGHTIGCVGAEDTSQKLLNSAKNSWDYEDNASAAIQLLRDCKLYVGLDTAPSHLASFVSVPMIVFQHNNPLDSSTWIMKKMSRNWFLDLGKHVTDTTIIYKEALKFLKP